MIFFAFLFVFVIYFAIAFYLARKLYRHTQERGKGRLAASAVAGFVLFLAVAVVFWDAVPTWYTHHRLCKTEAGLKVYVTPEEWAKNNPERFAQIQPVPKTSSGEIRKTAQIELDIDHINSEFDSVVEREKDYGFGVMRIRHRFIDSKTGQILTEDVDFAGGVSGGSIATGTNSLADYKFWLTTLGCGFAYPEMRGRYDADRKVGGKIYNTILEWSKK